MFGYGTGVDSMRGNLLPVSCVHGLRSCLSLRHVPPVVALALVAGTGRGSFAILLSRIKRVALFPCSDSEWG